VIEKKSCIHGEIVHQAQFITAMALHILQ